MNVPHISNIKYKGFHPIDKKRAIKTINRFIDEFNALNEQLTNQSIEIWANFCKELAEKVDQSSLFYHKSYLLKFTGYAVNKAQDKINKATKSRKKEFEKYIKTITTNPKLTLKIILDSLKSFYGRSGIEGYKQSEINKLKDSFDRNTATTFLTIKSFLNKQQQKKVLDLNKKIDKFVEKIEKEYPESHFHYQKSLNIKSALNQMKQILSGSNTSLSKGNIDYLTKCIISDRNANSIITSDKPIPYAPFPNSTIATNKIILSFMGMITDGGSHIEKLIKNYIEAK